MKSARRGFTLVEMMAVVAILGIMSGLAVASITAMTRTGRVNGAAASLARVMTTVRQRAVAERCTYVLQINGRTYTAAAATPDVRPQGNVALLYRKNDCGVSGVRAYEPGLAVALRDKLVNTYELAEFFVELEFPVAVMAAGTPSGRLQASSVSVSWDQFGRGAVWMDDDEDGVSTEVVGVLPMVITVRALPATIDEPSRVVNVPLAGTAVAL